MKWLNQLYEALIAGKQKAVAAAIVALVATFAVNHGVTLTPTLKDSLQALLVAFLSHQAVYWTSNTK